jgi:TonB-linked SusC/RagA family outer membrane protein
MKRILLVCLTAVFSLGISIAGWAQDRTVSGIITSAEDGSALPGVNILLKGTTIGTSTDAQGKYSLSVPSVGGTLVISFIGLQSQEIVIGDRTTIDVPMSTDATQLSEIVVVGYGEQDRRTLTSAISSVKGDQIALVPVQSFDQALVGKASGVQINLGTGLVGQAPRVRIRGINSLTSGAQPLYVVDGVPVTSDNLSATANGNPLGDINPNDIASVDVLKDGAATAIYGSRAANGVILITTKRGKSGKPKINYDFQTGVNTIAKRFDVLNANEFIAINNEKFATTNTAPQAFAGPGNVDTDWQKVIFHNGIMQNHNLSLSGGSEDISYYMSAGYMKQEGATVGNSVSRYSMRANIDYNGVKWLTAGMKLGVTRQVNESPNTGAGGLSGNVTSALKAFPNVPVYDAANATGYNLSADNAGLGRGNNLLDIASKYTNPAYTTTHNKYQADNYRVLASGYLQANITDWLNVRTQLGADVADVDDFLSWDPIHGDGGGSNKGYVYRVARRVFRWNWQNTLNFKRTLAEDHNIGITLGNEYQKVIDRYFTADGTVFSNPVFVQNELITGSYGTQTSGGDYTQSGFDSYFGRLTYDFKKKYLLGFSIRNDALSSLPKPNRRGTFFGGSAGWVISEEAFFSIPAISELKVRGSYAEVGNTFINDFGYIGSYAPALYGTQAGLSFSQAGNPNLKWETSKKLDIGLDVGILSNRIRASLEYYKNDVDNLILKAPTSPTAGIPGNNVYSNIGALTNSGIEVTISTDNLRSGELRWTTDVTYSTNKNKVTALVNNSDIVFPYTVHRVGESANSIYAPEYAGVNAANGNPLYYKKDGSMVQGNVDNNTYYVYNPAEPTSMTQESTLSTADFKILGATTPKWFGGVNNTLRYKNFDFEVFLTYAGGNKVFNATRQNNLAMEFNNNSKEILNRWTPEHTNTDVPRLKYANSSFLNINSSRFVESGDFLRVQNISLGYTVSRKTLESFARGVITNLRVYAQVRNAFLFTKYKGSDPELNNYDPTVTDRGAYGIDNNTNPMLRTYNFGLSVGF